MTLKKPLFYLFVLVLLMVGTGCGTPAATPEQPQMFRPRNGNTTTERSLGNVVAADGLDDEGCATNTVRDFDENDAVYVVLEDSTFPQGTQLFARLYRDNQAVEDTEELVADQAYTNVCVNFVFEPSARAEVWGTGDYEVEFYVNGNAYGAVAFEIR